VEVKGKMQEDGSWETKVREGEIYDEMEAAKRRLVRRVCECGDD